MKISNLPYLEPYTTRDSRHRCPRCNHARTFTFYIDPETGKPIHRTVGRCDREIKCGYHYTPREYYRDNLPLCGDLFDGNQSKGNGEQISGNGKQISRNGKFSDETVVTGDLFGVNSNQSGMNNNQSETIDYIKILDEKIDCISHRYVICSKSSDSNFVSFLYDHFPGERIEEAIDRYALGATRNRRVIFWQIDIDDNVRTGKIMQYNPQTGKRVRNERGGINWVHNILKKRSYVFQNYNLCQCYFGEHLLKLFPNKPVAIVEAEKTAVIGSIHTPDFIWLAAGNLNGLNVPKSRVLRNRNVMLFPDAGCYEKWAEKMKRISREVNCTMEVSDVVEKHATEEQLINGYDFADYVIEKLKGDGENEKGECDSNESDSSEPAGEETGPTNNIKLPSREPSPALQKMIDKNPSLTTLIDRFGLVEV
jgi:hypothetical protein